MCVCGQLWPPTRSHLPLISAAPSGQAASTPPSAALLFCSTHVCIHFVAPQICIFGTIANILNIMVLTRKEMAKAPINNILKWLAVADMFVMLEYIPYTTYQYIYMKPGKQQLNRYPRVAVTLPLQARRI